MNMRGLLVILLLLVQSSMSYSQTAKVRLERGKKAPFAGWLLTDKAMARIIADYEGKLKALKLQMEKTERDQKVQKAAATAICEAKVDGQVARCKAARGGWDTEKRLYEGALAKAVQPPPWYKSPYVNFLLGTIVTGGVVASTYAASR